MDFECNDLVHSERVEYGYSRIDPFTIFTSDVLTAVTVQKLAAFFYIELRYESKLSQQDFVYFNLIVK